MAVALVAINTFGGFLVTERMLEMFKKKEPEGEAHVTGCCHRTPSPFSYLVASVLFILALKGLSHPLNGPPGQPLRHHRHG